MSDSTGDGILGLGSGFGHGLGLGSEFEVDSSVWMGLGFGLRFWRSVCRYAATSKPPLTSLILFKVFTNQRANIEACLRQELRRVGVRLAVQRPGGLHGGQQHRGAEERARRPRRAGRCPTILLSGGIFLLENE